MSRAKVCYLLSSHMCMHMCARLACLPRVGGRVMLQDDHQRAGSRLPWCFCSCGPHALQGNCGPGPAHWQHPPKSQWVRHGESRPGQCSVQGGGWPPQLAAEDHVGHSCPCAHSGARHTHTQAVLHLYEQLCLCVMSLCFSVCMIPKRTTSFGTIQKITASC